MTTIIIIVAIVAIAAILFRILSAGRRRPAIGIAHMAGVLHAPGKGNGAAGGTGKVWNEEMIRREQENLDRALADVSAELHALAREFCLETSTMFEKWMNEHVDGCVNEHPDRIIQMGKDRIGALKTDLDLLRKGLFNQLTESLLSAQGGKFLDNIDAGGIVQMDNLDADRLSISDTAQTGAELETSKSIDRKLAEIAGQLGRIMIAHDLIPASHQRWRMHKGNSHCVYNGAILWSDGMRAIFDEYTATKEKYRAHKARIPDLQNERLKLEAMRIWRGLD